MVINEEELVSLESRGHWCLQQGKDRSQQKQIMAATYTPQPLSTGRDAVPIQLDEILSHGLFVVLFFLVLSHHYVHLLARMMYLMCYFLI